MAFASCVAKPFYGVVFAKSFSEKIGPTHKQFLTDLTKGTKFTIGACLWEAGAYTFVVDPVPKGLGRGLTNSLKEFTGQKFRVRVRDSEGKTIVDGDAEPAEEEENTPQPQGAAPPPPPPTAEDPMAKFTARFKLIQPDIRRAIDAKLPQANDLKQRAMVAAEMAAKKDFTQANRLLDELQKMLKNLPVASTTPSTGPSPAAISDEFRKKWAGARQAWQAVSDTLDAQLANLQSALKKSNDEDFREIAEFGLNGVTGNFKVPLMAALKEMDNVHADTLPKTSARTRAIIAGFRKHLTSSAKIEACDDNPFGVKMSIRQTIGGGLDKLEEALPAAA